MKNLQKKKKFYLMINFFNDFFFYDILFLKPKKVISGVEFSLIQLIMLKNKLSLSKIKSSFFEKIVTYFIGYVCDFNNISIGNTFFIKFKNLVNLLNFIYFIYFLKVNKNLVSFLNFFLLKLNDQFFNLSFCIKFFKFVFFKKTSYFFFFFYRQRNLFYLYLILNKMFYLKLKTNFN